jgi:hypothetical protein
MTRFLRTSVWFLRGMFGDATAVLKDSLMLPPKPESWSRFDITEL